MTSIAHAVQGAICLLLTAGCASVTTPYQADAGGQKSEGGYSEERRGEGRYNVIFSATPRTPARVLNRYLMRRCAELTLNSGFDWFEVVEHGTESDVHVYVAPDNSYRLRYSPGYSDWQAYWRFYRYGMGLGGTPGDPVWWTKSQSSGHERLEARAEIVMSHGAVPPDQPATFDARRLLRMLTDPRAFEPRAGERIGDGGVD